MHAIGFTTFGGPDVLQALDLPKPQAGPGEVRVRVRAITVNPTDTAFRRGDYALAMGDLEPPYVPGMDAAGEIDQLGDGVSGWTVGDRVMAMVLPMSERRGAYAEQIVLPARAIVRIPAGASFAEASTLSMNGQTARYALDVLDLPAGSWLAVTGAAGAVGGYLIALAKAEGLNVIADAADHDRELVRSFGADQIVARGDDVADRIRSVRPDGVDGLVDAATLEERTFPAVRDGGGLVVLRGWDGETPRGIVLHRIFCAAYHEEREKLDRLRQQAEDGVLALRVSQTFPATVEALAEAHRILDAGGRRGALVVDFDAPR